MNAPTATTDTADTFRRVTNGPPNATANDAHNTPPRIGHGIELTSHELPHPRRLWTTHRVTNRHTRTLRLHLRRLR